MEKEVVDVTDEDKPKGKAKKVFHLTQKTYDTLRKLREILEQDW